MLYDVEILLNELNLTDQEKEDLLKDLRDEFPEDDMLFELHLYRAVQFFKKQRNNR